MTPCGGPPTSTGSVSPSGCGVALRALAVAYARRHRTFGKKIVEHQAISFKLAGCEEVVGDSLPIHGDYGVGY